MISISTIFQAETTALESQVAALQAQIAAHTARIALLNEVETLADGSLEALKAAIDKVSSLAPDAIASLKSAVLSLFTGSDNSSDGGNTPVNPAPQPNDDGEVVAAIAPLEEPLTGQMCELTSPWYHPPADAAHVESDTACTVDTPEPEQLLDANNCSQFSNPLLVSDVPEPQPYVELIPVSHLVAYQRREDGEIICCYLAGNNKSRLKDWGSWLCNQHSVGSGFELREAKRMTAYKWELKIWGMSIKQIQRLAETDTAKTPPSRYHVASFPVAEKLLAPEVEDVQHVPDREVEAVLTSVVKSELGVEPESQGFQVGDRVEVISDRHGVELVGQSGIVTAGTAAGAAVNVNGTLRWFCSDEVTLIEASPTPRNPADDLFPTASTPTPTIVPAYNPNPMGRAGATANWKARLASGIGVNLKDCGTGGIKTIEEWQQIEAEQKAEKALAATASTPDDEPDF